MTQLGVTGLSISHRDASMPGVVSSLARDTRDLNTQELTSENENRKAHWNL